MLRKGWEDQISRPQHSCGCPIQALFWLDVGGINFPVLSLRDSTEGRKLGLEDNLLRSHRILVAAARVSTLRPLSKETKIMLLIILVVLLLLFGFGGYRMGPGIGYYGGGGISLVLLIVIILLLVRVI